MKGCFKVTRQISFPKKIDSNFGNRPVKKPGHGEYNWFIFFQSNFQNIQPVSHINCSFWEFVTKNSKFILSQFHNRTGKIFYCHHKLNVRSTTGTKEIFMALVSQEYLTVETWSSSCTILRTCLCSSLIVRNWLSAAQNRTNTRLCFC